MLKTHAIIVERYGDPSVMVWTQTPLEAPAAGEALVRHTAVGVNYVDVYDRSGLYPMALPSILGREAAGVVEAIGPGVRGLAPGDRVAYTYPIPGAYAERRVCPAERLVRLPDTITDTQAAAVMLKGLTARYLLRETFKVRAGATILVHAAAGGVGLLLVQWARSLGARVIGIVGSDAKAAHLRALGCELALIRGRDDIVATVRDFTGGRGVPVVYDAVGKDTLETSLSCLARRGLLVSYGNASGAVPPVAPLELMRRGSLYLTRPTLIDYIPDRRSLRKATTELFAVVGSGTVKVHVGRTLPLRSAADAHRELEAAATLGSTVLLP